MVSGQRTERCTPAAPSPCYRFLPAPGARNVPVNQGLLRPWDNSVARRSTLHLVSHLGARPTGRVVLFCEFAAGGVAEWQTRMVQVHVSERTWGFNSPLPHLSGPGVRTRAGVFSAGPLKSRTKAVISGCIFQAVASPCGAHSRDPANCRFLHLDPQPAPPTRNRYDLFRGATCAEPPKPAIRSVTTQLTRASAGLRLAWTAQLRQALDSAE